MKVKVTIVFFFLSLTTIFSQSGINYKAVVKDDLGNVLVNQQVIIQFSILETPNQINVYQETHVTSTNANGIVIINIGEGTTTDNFDAINWGNDIHYLNVQIDRGLGFVDLGTTQFKTVPYAINAANVVWKQNTSNDVFYDNPGHIGVGTNTPSQKLDVQGKLKVGDDGNSPEKGTVRYNFLDNVFEGHNGTQWDRMTKEDETKPYFKAVLTANTTFSGIIQFDNIVYDNKNGFVGTNPIFYNVQESGFYFISISVLSLSDLQVVYLIKNGARVSGFFANRDPINDGLRITSSFNTIIFLEEGDSIYVEPSAVSGGSINIMGFSNFEATYIFGYKLF
ncbi:hypothetical protein [Psychroserpens sp. SPM9]|uniref:C1q-like domain-containing protein n=1 Tax=Psychroserpens sp. SPM9 TaxID=2975598 RepID=UPI0021A77B42|nr:hypothetical protein [Psychroserpens sp. SPM9]MDG5491222.1 hypothetical protein [Psychroserpens sp. SPM9]